MAKGVRASICVGNELAVDCRKERTEFRAGLLITLYVNLSKVPSERFLEVGALIRQDFIDLSSSLEKITFQFFESEARKLHLGDLAENHKYALEETKRRLRRTIMLSKWREIEELVKSTMTGSDAEE